MGWRRVRGIAGVLLSLAAGLPGCATDDFWEPHYVWAARHGRLGDFHEVQRALGDALALVDSDTADPYGRVFVPSVVASVCLWSTETESAHAMALRAEHAAESSGARDHVRGLAQLTRGLVESARGEGRAAMRACARAEVLLRSDPKYGDPLRGDLLRCHGRAHAARGDHERARLWLERARDVKLLEEGLYAPSAFLVRLDLASVDLLREDPVRALRELDDAGSLIGSLIASDHAAAIRYWSLRGRVLADLGRTRAAADSRRRAAWVANRTPACLAAPRDHAWVAEPQ